MVDPTVPTVGIFMLRCIISDVKALGDDWRGLSFPGSWIDIYSYHSRTVLRGGTETALMRAFASRQRLGRLVLVERNDLASRGLLKSEVKYLGQACKYCDWRNAKVALYGTIS